MSKPFLYELLCRGSEDGSMAFHVVLGQYLESESFGETQRTLKTIIVDTEGAKKYGFDLETIFKGVNAGVLQSNSDLQKQIEKIVGESRALTEQVTRGEMDLISASKTLETERAAGERRDAEIKDLLNALDIEKTKREAAERDNERLLGENAEQAEELQKLRSLPPEVVVEEQPAS